MMSSSSDGSDTGSSQQEASPPDEERRRYNLVHLDIQLGLVVFVVSTVLIIALPMASYIYLSLDLFASTVHRLVEDPLMLEHLHQVLWKYGYVVGATVIIALCMVTFYALWISNKVTGPLYRISEELREMRRTGETHTIHIRSGDYYQDFVDELNETLQTLDRTPNAPPGSRES